MPSLYGFTSNANVRVGNTTGLYQQPGGSVAVLSSAQVLLNNLSQNGNVNFALDPAYGNTKVLAYTADNGVTAGTYGSGTQIPIVTVTGDGRVSDVTLVTVDPSVANYGNANVAAYLPTYTGSLENSSSIVSLRANAVAQQTSIDNLDAEYTSLNSTVISQGSAIGVLQANAATQAGQIAAKANIAGQVFTGNVQAPYFIGDGSQLTNIPTTSGSVQLIGNVTGSGTTGSPINTTIAASGVTPGTYGSDTTIPTIVVGLDGRVTQITTNAISGGGSYGNANVAAYLPTYTGALENSSSVINLWANAATQASQIAGANAAIITANTAMKGYVDAQDAAITAAWTANAATQAGEIQTISANLGSFQTYANVTYQTIAGAYGNANVAAYLPTYTGNISANSITTTDGIFASGNVSAPNFVGSGQYLTDIVTKIVAGANIAISPAGGQGQVTISQIGGVAPLTSTGYYGSFYDTTTQYANVATTAYTVNINSTVGTNGVSLVNGNAMSFSYSGVYQVAFSIQFVNTDNAQHEANVWLTQNDVPLSYTNSQVTVPARASSTKPGAILMTVPVVITVNAGDTVGLQWQQDSGSSVVSIASFTSGTSPTRPATPGIIIYATQVTSVTGNMYGDSNVALFLGSNFGSNTITTTGAITAGNVVSTAGYFWANGAPYAPPSTPTGAAGGDLTGTYPNPTLTTSGVLADTYGSATQVAQITFDAKGRATSASNVTISGVTPGGSAGGDLTGTYPNPTLTTSGVLADTYGSATSVPQFTVDAKGRITAASNVAISVAGSSFNGNLAGNVLYDSVNNRFLANAFPLSTPLTSAQLTGSGFGTITTVPVYTSGNLTQPAVSQVIGGAVTGNVNFLTNFSSTNRTTQLFNTYVQAHLTSSNTSVFVQDRIRSATFNLDVNLNGKNWGQYGAAMTSVSSAQGSGGAVNILGSGLVGGVVGQGSTITITPTNGSANAAFVSGVLNAISHVTTGTGATISNIGMARMYSGFVTGQGNLARVDNAAMIHVPNGWVSSNVSLVTNAYALLNEDARSLIQTSGNIVSTGTSNRYGTMQTYNERVVALGNVTGTITGNVTAGSVVTLTATGNVTLNTTDITNAVSGSSITFIITQDGTGSRVLTSNLKYAGGSKTLSTAAGSIDTINVFYDGTNYLAALVKGYA